MTTDGDGAAGPAGRVRVIIVNWNAAPLLPACLDSVLRQTGVEVAITVVDNASSDASLAVLAPYGDRADVDVIASPENLGFGAGNNLALRQAGESDVTVFLNPDTELLDADTLATLIAPLADPAIGMVGPRLLNADGTLQRSVAAFPSLRTIAVTGFGLHALLSNERRARWAANVWTADRSASVDWLIGACLALRTADAEVLGGFSEATFMYGEDMDLADRVHQRGSQVWFAYDARVAHLDNYSAAQRWSSAETAAKAMTAELVFMDATAPRWRARAARLLLTVAYGGRAVVLARLGRKERAEVYAALAQAVRA